MSKKHPTIVDIANNLNISSASVSRALRNVGKVGPVLRQKILDEAKRIGYSPNPAARAFRSQSTHLIGLIVPSFFSYQIDELVTEIQSVAQNEDFGIILGITMWDADKELDLLNFMATKRVEGIIIKSRGTADALEKMYQLSTRGINIVSLLDEIDFPNINSVVVDNIKGGYLAAKHLLELGHERILYITNSLAQLDGEHTSHFSNDRQIGMLKAYEEAGIKRPESLVVYDQSVPGESKGDKIVSEILSKNIDFSAIFAYDDSIAAATARAFKSRGFRIPEDISIVGFDDSKLVNETSDTPITVIKQPDKQVAYEAFNLIVGDSSKSRVKNRENVYMVEPEFINRGSTLQYKPKTDTETTDSETNIPV